MIEDRNEIANRDEPAAAGHVDNTTGTAAGSPGDSGRPVAPILVDGTPVDHGARTEPDERTSDAASTIPAEELARLTDDIVAALKTVYDPEIPADIYELGLIYKVDIDDERNVAVEMTLTAPGCPVAGEMPLWVRDAVAGVAGIRDVNVELVFTPPWDMSRMSDEARLAIGMY